MGLNNHNTVLISRLSSVDLNALQSLMMATFLWGEYSQHPESRPSHCQWPHNRNKFKIKCTKGCCDSPRVSCQVCKPWCYMTHRDSRLAKGKVASSVGFRNHAVSHCWRENISHKESAHTQSISTLVWLKGKTWFGVFFLVCSWDEWEDFM